MTPRYRLFLLCCALTMATACAYARGFRLEGRIEGLQAGDTLRFERILLPSWKYAPGFDVVVRKPGAFRYRGKSEHDRYYLMTYRPKAGRAAAGDRGGKPVIVRPGDRIDMTGSADAIYYCRLGGGIYDEPALSSLLAVDDSLGRIRGRYLENAREASERNDAAASREWSEKFSRFYDGNPGVDRKNMLRKAYEAANPHGSLYLLIDKIPMLSYTPAKEAHRAYETLSEGLKKSYFGRMYADCMARMEQLAEGKPAPDFTLVTTEGRTVTKADFKDRYLLLYHWGLCPGSIYIDRQVRDLSEKYREKGLQVVGLTESIADIRSVYESLPAGEKTPSAGVDDIRPVLASMLEHGWIEAELETGHPENRQIMEAYAIEGWPFFVLIGPDGTIQARNYTNAFYQAKKILGGEPGGTAAE